MDGTALVPLEEAAIELIRLTSTTLPDDVVDALANASAKESSEVAKSVIATIQENCRLASEESVPLCQDTGSVLMTVRLPFGMSQRKAEEELRRAVAAATKKAYLRPNAVDPVSGKNSGDNLGIGVPFIHFEETGGDEIVVEILLKGGGSENVGAQYSLPNIPLSAGRDLEGVRKVVIDSIYNAQGKGCSPGVIGIGIGGDRGSSFLESKRQLKRKLTDTNPDPELAALEERIRDEANMLGIGPLGLGGRTTVLAVKAGKVHRHPASFFVSVSYNCWAVRRRSMRIGPGGEVRYGD